MTRVVDDSFTEGSDTELSLHTPETGTGWTAEEDAGIQIDVIAATGAATPSGGVLNQGESYSCSPTPDGEGASEYDVSFTSANADGGGILDAMGVFGRFTDTSNWYAGAISPPALSGANMRLLKKVGGTPTSLGTRDECAASNCHDGEEFVLRLRNTTNRLEFEKISTGGTITSDDSALTAAGKCGVGWGAAVGLSGADVGILMSITAFYWDDLNGGAPPAALDEGEPAAHGAVVVAGKGGMVAG